MEDYYEPNLRTERDGRQLKAIAFAIPAITILLVTLICLPLLNSGDDMFLMYQLAGGFGDKPSNLLHYDHIIHPVLGYVISRFYVLFPHLNWYTAFLLATQLTGWSLIQYVLLRRFRLIEATGIFFLLFISIGCFGILSLNLTFSAWLLSASAIFLLLQGFSENKIWHSTSCLFSVALLLLAGLIRLQIPLLLMVLFLPICWRLYPRSLKKYVIFIIALAFLLAGLNLLHKNYYRQHIAGWNREESARQDLFYAFNRPNRAGADNIFRDSIEKQFYQRLFLYDAQYPGAERLKELGKKITRIRNLQNRDDWEAIYWTWKNARLYLLIILIVIIIAVFKKKATTLARQLWLPLLVLLGLYVFLFVFLKITEAFYEGIWLAAGLMILLSWPHTPSRSSYRYRFLGLLLLLPLAWSVKRVSDQDKKNRANYQVFLCAQKELKEHSGNLFIATADDLPLGYFAIMDNPQDLPITNLLYKDRMITQSFASTLQRFGINDLVAEMGSDERIRLVGPAFPELVSYLRNKYGLQLNLSEKQNDFNCLEVRKLNRIHSD